MRYCITGSSKIAMNELWASRLCRAINAQFVDLIIDRENDRHPLFFITIEASPDLTEGRVQEIFGDNIKLRRNKNDA